MTKYEEREELIGLIARFAVDHNLVLPCASIADHLIANGVTIQQWIPAMKRLPDKEGSYPVFTCKGTEAYSYFFPERDIAPGVHKEAMFCWPGVTHWMPLPKPPKEE